MKKLSFTCLGILLSVCTSCSNSDEEEKDWTGQPSVTISDPVGEKDISITITPENAVAAAYTCIAEGGGSEPTAEEVLEKGIQIDATQPSTIVIDWLDYDTDYVVIAAVRSKEGTVASDTAEITTAKDPAIDLGQGANTYIVSKAGTYSFTPEKVDGTPIDGIASANWIWATKADENDKEQKLLDNVAYAGGKIRFTTTIERAKAFGFDAISASLEQLDRAHFYPEKHMMTLELVVERGTRRVLGIQGVCEDGDALKARIDAVATMLQFGKPTIDDLANAEIAYAPPFASAMDAVNAVANVADNILSGQLKPISSKEFGELWKDRANNNVFFADARPAVAGNATAAKYPGEWHAIALEDIEAKFDSIPKDRPVALVCNTGLRSYEVMLYLHNHGVTDVVNALGGMQALIKRGDNM